MTREKKTALMLYGLLGVVAVVCLVFVLRPQSGHALTAKIQVGNEIVWEGDLSRIQSGSFSIEQQTGLPITFEVQEQAIRFTDSDCPDKVCVKSGYQRNDMDIASCLPNQTVLFIEAK